MQTGEVLSIVLTGGPCAGKTSALSTLMEWLNGLGYRVAVVPESATELMTSGIKPQNFQDALFFQQVLTRNIVHKENLFALAARNMRTEDPAKPIILLCDRGIMDARAYIGDAALREVFFKEGLDYASACDGRYAGVIHLRTAADGAEAYYTLANNKIRSESPEEARLIDVCTERAWNGHHRLMIVDNSTSFAGKILRTQQVMSTFLGIPSPLEFERKFRFMEVPESIDIPIPQVKVVIEQYYLDGDRERIRVRIRNGASTFFYTVKENYPGLERVKVDRIISREEFSQLLDRRDHARGVVRKERTHFVWKNQYFELDYFFHNRSWLLEVRLTQEQSVSILPSFLPEMIDVTNDPRYYNFNIAASIVD